MMCPMSAAQCEGTVSNSWRDGSNEYMAWPLRFSAGAFETRRKREIHHEKLKITMGGLPHLHFGGPHLQVPMPDHYKLHPQNPCLGGQLLEGETNPLPRHVWSSSGGKARFTSTCKKGTWSRSHNPKSIPEAFPLQTTLSDHPKTQENPAENNCLEGI